LQIVWLYFLRVMEGGFIPTAVTSLKVITPVIAQLANSETAKSARRKARVTKRKEGQTEQDILSRISAPRGRVVTNSTRVCMKLRGTASNSRVENCMVYRELYGRQRIGPVCTWKPRVRHGYLEDIRALKQLRSAGQLELLADRLVVGLLDDDLSI
jgi:hypothetical protein